MTEEVKDHPEVKLPKKRGRPKKIKPAADIAAEVVVVSDDPKDPVITETVVTTTNVEKTQKTNERNSMAKRKTARKGKRQSTKTAKPTMWQRVQAVLTKKVF